MIKYKCRFPIIGGLKMKKTYRAPIAICQWIEAEDIVCVSGGLVISEDTAVEYGPLIPLG